MGARMSAMSVRMSDADVRRIKSIARRLGVRDSDLFRYAVKTKLMKLSPLADPDVGGRQLLPVLLEAGSTFIRYFDLDASRLGEILNAGVTENSLLVEPEDLKLISMVGMQEAYALLQFNELAIDFGELPSDRDAVAGVLRAYLYDKYAFSPQKSAVSG